MDKVSPEYTASSEYTATIEEQRQQRTAMLLEERSWFTLAGLYWLKPGDNTFGHAPTNDIVLPGAATPSHAGRFVLDGDQITVHAAPNVSLTTDVGPIQYLTMQPDTAPAPDFVSVGDLTMVVIHRGERVGIRLYDRSSPHRQNFAGLRWYAVDLAYRVAARFVPYDPLRPLDIVNILGDHSTVGSPGYVVFTLGGIECRLDAQPVHDGLFFNFRDGTNGATTYGAGRFLSTPAPQEDDTVILDFNMATNPFCAYTVYATCPLPPVQNQLPVCVHAGEMKYP